MKKFTMEILVEDGIDNPDFITAFNEVISALRYSLCCKKYNSSFIQPDGDCMARWSMKEVAK